MDSTTTAASFSWPGQVTPFAHMTTSPPEVLRVGRDKSRYWENIDAGKGSCMVCFFFGAGRGGKCAMRDNLNA